MKTSATDAQMIKLKGKVELLVKNRSKEHLNNILKRVSKKKVEI